MRFQIPQFIETETKIVGPFTLKQFLWLAGGGSIVLLLFMTIKSFVFYVLAIPIAGVFIAFAFLKIGDVPLIIYVTYAISYLTNPKKYLFRKEQENKFTP